MRSFRFLCLLLCMPVLISGCSYAGTRSAQRAIEENDDQRAAAGRPRTATHLVIPTHTGAAAVLGQALVREISKITPFPALLVHLSDSDSLRGQPASDIDDKNLLFLGTNDMLHGATIISPIALTHGVLIVRAHSPWYTPEDLWDARLSNAPPRIGGNSSQDERRLARILKAAAQPPEEAFILCADRSAVLLLQSGELDVACVDSLETLEILLTNDVRVLLSTAPEARYGAPTCEELYGLPADEWYILAGSDDMSQEALVYWRDFSAEITTSESWRSLCASCGWTPYTSPPSSASDNPTYSKTPPHGGV